jgi:AcrR family transcriptional regulator
MRDATAANAQASASKAKARYGPDVSARKRQILEIAAQLFARKGYRGTSIRDIGEQAGVLGGSLYHHIKSKDALFVELHSAALAMAEERIAEALAHAHDPWSRLEAACIAHLEVQADADSLTFPLMNDFREVPEDVRQQLIDRRDAFELQFRELVAALPLPSDIDRSVYRNLLLSQLNNAADWYRPGRLSVADIGREIARIFRHT